MLSASLQDTGCHYSLGTGCQHHGSGEQVLIGVNKN